VEVDVDERDLDALAVAPVKDVSYAHALRVAVRVVGRRERAVPCITAAVHVHRVAGRRRRHCTHRQRIVKYLDTLLANEPISDGEAATDHCQKRAPQDGGLPELIVARSCLTNHSEAASL